MALFNVEREKVKDKLREEKRRIGNVVEAVYNRKEREEKRMSDGSDKWMLPSVEARIESDSTKQKSKKHKKKKKRKKCNSESESRSEEEQWVEKLVVSSTENQVKEVDTNEEKSQTERDAWMMLPGLIPCVSNEDRKLGLGKLNKKDEEKEKLMLNTLGQSDRELNPYWKDGGTGLPAKDHGSFQQLSTKVGDRGAEWLRRALQRAKEQAEEEGRSLEDVAIQRWGSLAKLESMLVEAESRNDRTKRDWHKERREFDKNYREYEKVDERKHRRKEEKSERHSERRERDEVKKSNRSSSEYSRHQGSSRNPRGFQKPEVNSDYSKLISSQGTSSSGSKNWRKKDLVGSGSSVQDKRASIMSERSSKSPLNSLSSTDADWKEETENTNQNYDLTDKEMNEVGARLIKAEILGDEALAANLKNRLEQARAIRNQAKVKRRPQGEEGKFEMEEETVVLTKTDVRGFVRPLQEPSQPEPSGGRRKNQKVETHSSGERIRFFADDEKYSLQDMFVREKLNTVEDENEAFCKLAAKGIRHTDSDYDIDDLFVENARMKESDGKVQARERERAIREHRRLGRVLDVCHWCFDSKLMLKHMVIAIGTKAYLCLPSHQSLVEGHCLIVPMHHIPCATQLDEDIWAEIQTFRKVLTTMFLKRGLDVVFFESAMHLQSFPHMALECIPMPKEIGDLAPIYFKKAILECDVEWATNKKVIDLSQKDVRRSIPKNLPYFAVDFGLQGGFAHVIEDEKLFPKNFAQEIIGGMLDLDHSVWRKRRRDNFDAQLKKVVQFAEWWKPYDFTKKSEDSD